MLQRQILCRRPSHISPSTWKERKRRDKRDKRVAKKEKKGKKRDKEVRPFVWWAKFAEVLSADTGWPFKFFPCCRGYYGIREHRNFCQKLQMIFVVWETHSGECRNFNHQFIVKITKAQYLLTYGNTCNKQAISQHFSSPFPFISRLSLFISLPE